MEAGQVGGRQWYLVVVRGESTEHVRYNENQRKELRESRSAWTDLHATVTPPSTPGTNDS